MKKCAKCGVKKTLEDFYRQKTSSDGRGSYCKECNKAEVKAFVRAHPDKVVNYSRAGKMRYEYGISPEDYEVMLAAQGGVCAICKRGPSQRRLHLDHCHDTGVNRGILCHQCNIGLGMFRNSTYLLAEAIKYLS